MNDLSKKTYIPYHVHTDDSLLDSCTKYKEYVDKCVEDGYKAICFTEHGNVYEWVGKKMYCDEKGIKYLHGVEIYITKTHDEKIRDNMHTILIAKNSDGFKEINTIVKLATKKDHTYYKPRISVDEFLGISDNVIKISACVASPLNSIRKGNLSYKDREIISHYDYLEIQLHKFDEQVEYNNWLYELSKTTGIPLIVGTDFHSINKYKGECRAILQLSKKIAYSLEDSLDLSYKTYDELIDMAKEQGSEIPLEVIEDALLRTNNLYDLCDEIVLDKSFKYPVLSDNDEELIENQLKELYEDKCNMGLIDRDDNRYIPRIKEELDVFKKLGMCSFMAYMGNLVRWCRANDIPVSPNRGSVGGSLVAFILDIIDVDPIKWNTIFSRFANEHRKELGDIDLDFIPRQRPLVFQHIKEEMPPDKTSRILSFGTVARLNCIEIICKGLKEKWFNEHKNLDPKKDEKKCPYSLDMEKVIKSAFDNDEEKARKEYKDVFYYYDGLIGANIQQQYHNAGIIVSPVTLTDNYGTFYGEDSDGNEIDILQIDMDMAHDVCLVKYDILGLNTLGIVDDAYKMSGLKFPRMNEVNFTDKNVFDDIKEYPIGIFQFENPKSHNYLVRYDIQTVNDITLCNAALRPSGDSYRDRLMNHEFNHNPSKEIDDLLAENMGFIVYQEDTIKFLTNICDLNGSDADNIRRAIGHKDHKRLAKAMPAILDGYCKHSSQPREVAENEAKTFIQILEDASSYQFGFNHSTGYSMLGYVCGLLRHYHTIEFITSYLKNVEKLEDFSNGEALAKYKGINISLPKFRKSKGDYFCDKDTNTIYKGIGSLKYLNNIVADELYELRDRKFDSFIELLMVIKEETSINTRQLDLLIHVDFFEEFGNIGKLSKLSEIFNNIWDKTKKCFKKQMGKDKVEQSGLTHEAIKAYCHKETDKTYMQIDFYGLIKDIESNVPFIDISDYEKASYQQTILKHVSIIDKKYKGIAVVSAVDTKYSPKITCFALANGNTIECKIDKRTYAGGQLEEGDVIEIKDTVAKPRQTKNENGKWVDVPGTKVYWITGYRILFHQKKEK